jgi:hypothetical protein
MSKILCVAVPPCGIFLLFAWLGGNAVATSTACEITEFRAGLRSRQARPGQSSPTFFAFLASFAATRFFNAREAGFNACQCLAPCGLCASLSLPFPS